jgi:hypothetical protein
VWWHTELGCCPPLLIGGGFGHGPQAKHLGYFEKRKAIERRGAATAELERASMSEAPRRAVNPN